MNFAAPLLQTEAHFRERTGGHVWNGTRAAGTTLPCLAGHLVSFPIWVVRIMMYRERGATHVFDNF